MEGLNINTIPNNLLGRILLQIPNLPSHENLDLINILQTALQEYGQTDNLDAFLDYCQTLSKPEIPWLWKNYTIKVNEDWENANSKKPQQLVGIRFLLASETARQNVELTRFAKNMLYDPKCTHFFQGRPIPVNDLLQDTLHYFKREKNMNPLVEALINLRLDKYEQDKSAFERQTSELDDTDYHLLGALMVRYDSTASRGSAPRSWCLYLRDYMENADGSIWRILLEDDESRVISDQALADIRGSVENKVSPSEFSKDYRPVYLFYGNLDISHTKPEEREGYKDGQTRNHIITLEDYTFDDDDEYRQDQLIPSEQDTPQEEDEACKHCGIKDIIEDCNDMFFCELCNQGVHQLCEVPPIEMFEKELDPWYCRTCCKAQNIPIPTAPPAPSSQSLEKPLDSENVLKRKREDAGSNGDGSLAKKAL